ncbi:cyclopropane-fatty-acyl-phospholipid synthase family protein [Corynebacterium sp.]|uniref:cyclopropane-fatty-acyl-phospholipid synthase family protein n=1 Tax=Corynebacterium sp. TaxID=1720 RepID=UPI0028AD6F5E|nr:cyclopropane-fatty-acyl-phospholipid synthase family protein [Corynebacterium sp.]
MTSTVTSTGYVTAAERLVAVITQATGVTAGDLPVQIRAWDGSTAGPDGVDCPTLVVKDPQALTRLLWSPGELGLAQAYVTGEIDAEPDDALTEGFARLTALARRPEVRVRLTPSSLVNVVRGVKDLGGVGRRPAPPASQAHLRGRVHTRDRDRSVIAHHYDLSNEFYAQILDETMSYSCAYFGDDPDSIPGTPGATLEDAQRAKLDLVCRALDLTEGQHLLDVGCGWGSTAVHAAENYRVQVTAVTISREQRDWVHRLIRDRGLQDRVTVLLLDYRDITGEFDAVSSIEMGEHVGQRNYPSFIRMLHDRVRPGGRVLIQQMSRRGRHPGGGPFIEAFIAPDMHMRPLGDTVSMLEDGGLEVRAVRGMRDDYARTVDHWIDRFHAHRDRIIDLVGEEVFRVWHLYLVGGGMAFRQGRMGVDQILSVRRPVLPDEGV